MLRRTSGGVADTLWTRREYVLVGLAAAIQAADSPPRICHTSTLTTTPHSRPIAGAIGEESRGASAFWDIRGPDGRV